MSLASDESRLPAEAQDPDMAGSGSDLVDAGQVEDTEAGPTSPAIEGAPIPPGQVLLAGLEESAAGKAEGGPSGDDAGPGRGPEPVESDGEPDAATVAAASLLAGDDMEQELREQKQRRRLLVLLAVLLLSLCCTVTTFVRYVNRAVPLPDLLPLSVGLNYAPDYQFSMNGLDKPVGVALSPEGDRLYVAETGGDRWIKILDREGHFLGAFAPPRTEPAERSPVYVATDESGRVLVADRLQHALFVYDRDGQYLDTILGPDLTLSAYVSGRSGGLQPGAEFAYDAFEGRVHYQRAGSPEQTLPMPGPSVWSPLGIRVDARGTLLVTDVSPGHQAVHRIPGEALLDSSRQGSNPGAGSFGGEGQGYDEMLFPNVAVTDSQGRIYVTDGNNGRISVWSEQGVCLFHFGRGAGEGALNLPRGAAIDARDRLHVVDALGQVVRVYDVSEDEPRFLFAFGDWGQGDGQFNYPNDIALDARGHLYIADRENNRIQVWSY